MKMYIDTEFNEYKGALISMALVAEDGSEWYEVVPCPHPGSWVAEHVLPKLNRQPTSYVILQKSLAAFLKPYEAVHIVADWPEDIQHFCEALIAGPGLRYDTPLLTMEVRRDLDNTSEVSLNPHNALADARALRFAAQAKDSGRRSTAAASLVRSAPTK